MIKINLIPPVERVKERPKIALPPIAIYDVVGVLVLVAVLLWIFFSCTITKSNIAGTKSRINTVKKELSALQEVVNRVNHLKKRKSELQGLVSQIEGLKPYTVQEVIVLDEISKILPDYMWINKFNHNSSANTISIEGTTFSALSLADFITNIKKSNLFENVTLKSFSKREQEKVEVITFQMEINVAFDQVLKIAKKEG